MEEIKPAKKKRNLLNVDTHSKTFQGLDMEGRIDKLSAMLGVGNGVFTPEDILIENYSQKDTDKQRDAHLLLERKRRDESGNERLYKIISTPTTTLRGEKIFNNLLIDVPANEDIAEEIYPQNFCRELSSLTTGHGHKDPTHGTVVGEMAHRNLMFLKQFLSTNDDCAYERLRETLFEVINKREGYFEQIYYGAMLHDIGKCLIPEDILNVPRKLSKEEIKIIKKHSFYGKLITKGIPGIEMSHHIAEKHHEGWDGVGYEGLKGEKINFSSRIVGLVDKIDALLGARIYNKEQYDDEKVKSLFTGESCDERGNFRGYLDPQIEQIYFKEKILINEDGKKRFVPTYKVSFSNHRIIREREEKRLAA